MNIQGIMLGIYLGIVCYGHLYVIYYILKKNLTGKNLIKYILWESKMLGAKDHE